MFVCSRTISILAGKVALRGHLSLPRQAKGLVVFAPERGTSQLDARSSYLTQLLQEADFGTRCVDLLTPAETRSCPPGDCAALLTRRLVAVGRCVQRGAATSFGAIAPRFTIISTHWASSTPTGPLARWARSG